MTLLKTQLKELRLPSFIEMVERRVDEAISEKESYQDFLMLLCQDEIDRRKQNKRELRIKRANLSKIKSIVDFDFDSSIKTEPCNIISCFF